MRSYASIRLGSESSAIAFSSTAQTFIWPTPGGALPDEHAGRGVEITLGALPAAVLASAVRAAAVRQLVPMGFELRSNRVAQRSAPEQAQSQSRQ